MKSDFRVWDEINKGWITAEVALLCDGSYIVLEDGEWVKAAGKITIQPMIEVRDINNEMVFSGDIVKYRPPATTCDQAPEWITLVIEYVDVAASYRAVRDWDGEHAIHEDVMLEVIGNNKDNPELIIELNSDQFFNQMD